MISVGCAVRTRSHRILIIVSTTRCRSIPLLIRRVNNSSNCEPMAVSVDSACSAILVRLRNWLNARATDISDSPSSFVSTWRNCSWSPCSLFSGSIADCRFAFASSRISSTLERNFCPCWRVIVSPRIVLKVRTRWRRRGEIRSFIGMSASGLMILHGSGCEVQTGRLPVGTIVSF